MPSSVIRRHHYDADARALYIAFVSGQDYVYFDVPHEVAFGFRSATSKGRFFAVHIRDRFRFEHIVDPPQGWDG